MATEAAVLANRCGSDDPIVAMAAEGATREARQERLKLNQRPSDQHDRAEEEVLTELSLCCMARSSSHVQLMRQAGVPRCSHLSCSEIASSALIAISSYHTPLDHPDDGDLMWSYLRVFLAIIQGDFEEVLEGTWSARSAALLGDEGSCWRASHRLASLSNAALPTISIERSPIG